MTEREAGGGSGPEDDERRKTVLLYARYSHVGIAFVLVVLVFVALGWWVDERLGSSPLGVLVGLCCGFTIGFYHLYRTVFEEPPAPPKDGERRSP